MTLTHNFTLDELQAYDAGALSPERAAVVAAHLMAGCPACRARIAQSHEIGRLLHAARVAEGHAESGEDSDTQGPASTRTRRRLLRLRPRCVVVMLVILPLKGVLVRHLLRAPHRETRMRTALSLVALTAVVLRVVCARPTGPA